MFSRPASARVLAVAVAALVLSWAVNRAQEAAPDPDRDARAEFRIKARAIVLDTAHALAVAENATRRGTTWEGWLGPDGKADVPLQLFHGNTYHLVLGASGGDGGDDGLIAGLFDGRGKPVPAERVAGRGRLILSLAPAASGTYFLRLRPHPGKSGGAVSLTYVYH